MAEPDRAATAWLTPDRREALRREARGLHRRFFRGEIAAEVADRYAEAHAFCFGAGDPRVDGPLLRVLDGAPDEGLDVEAIEFALRVRGERSALTDKLQILFTLVEVRSRYYADFVNDGPARGRAYAALLAALPRSAWKLARGLYQLRSRTLA